MNTMKKILLAGGTVAMLFLLAGIFLVHAHAQDDQNQLGTININALVPNPATNQITVAGDATGGYHWNGEYSCGGSVEINIPTPIMSGYYYFDANSKTNYSYVLTQTHQGQSNDCNGRKYESYEYSFTFTDKTHISGLGAGVHTVTLCGIGATCTYETFTIPSTIHAACSVNPATVASGGTATFSVTPSGGGQD